MDFSGISTDELNVLLSYLNRSPLAFIEWDSGCRLKRWSEAAEKAFGWEAEEVVGKHFDEWRFIHRDDQGKVRQLLAELISGDRDTYVNRNRNYTRDGRIVHCEWFCSAVRSTSGELKSIFTLALDRSAEVEFEQRYQLASESAQVGMWHWDARSGDLIWSDQCQINFGLKPGEFGGTIESFKKLIHPEDRELSARVIEHAAKTGEPYSYEHRVVWPDGSVHWLEGRGRAFRDANGQLLRMTGTNVSIDERKKAEQERERLLESERAAVRLRDEFFSIASHELKTPLTPLKLQIGLLERRLSQGTDVDIEWLQKAVSIASRQISRLHHLVEGLLDVTRLDSGRLQLERVYVDAAQALADCASQFVDLARSSGCDLQIRSQGPVWTVIDLLRIEQVLTNLISNAIRYAPRKKIEVLIRNEGNQYLMIEVGDGGTGIAEKDRERIFERFERGSARISGGMGLGLYISREIARAHGGEIIVGASPLGGALFTVRVPIREKA